MMTFSMQENRRQGIISYRFKRTKSSTGAQFLVTIRGLPSDLHDLWRSGLEIIVGTMEGFICI